MLNGYGAISLNKTAIQQLNRASEDIMNHLGSGTDNTTILVQKPVGSQASSTFALLTTNYRLSNHVPWSTTIYYDVVNSTTGRLAATSPAGMLNNWHIVVLRRSGANMVVRVDGKVINSKTNASGTATSQSSTLFIGAYDDVGGGNFNGLFAEICNIPSAMSDADIEDIEDIEDYLAAKYGLLTQSDSSNSSSSSSTDGAG